MFDDDDFEDFEKKIEKSIEQHYNGWSDHDSGYKMKGSTIAYIALSVVAIAILFCWCCRRGRSRGQVLSPPVQTVVVSGGQPAPYPQQTYHHPPTHYPAAPYPHHVTDTSYHNAGAPYPAAGAPYPAAGAPYPAAGAPYPAAGAPYPPIGAPDPPGFTVTPAPPPTYNEAVTHEAYAKQSPYNPSYPHS